MGGNRLRVPETRTLTHRKASSGWRNANPLVAWRQRLWTLKAGSDSGLDLDGGRESQVSPTARVAWGLSAGEGLLGRWRRVVCLNMPGEGLAF